MVTDIAEKKPTKSGAAPPPEPEQLPCPRCDSTNTKFCYYNNYNFSQPRHFCKACRRYWTHGGTLRDIPIGGATRKNAKRSRSSPVYHRDFRHLPAAASSQLLGPFSAHHGNFTSLLSGAPAAGILSLGGFDDVGFGLGKSSWPFAAPVDGGDSSVGGETWQVESGENGFVGGGDCFAFPDLAISTPGSIFK